MIALHILLQKSHGTSKTKDHVAQLHCWLKTWAGDINQVVHEDHTIQIQLPLAAPQKQRNSSNLPKWWTKEESRQPYTSSSRERRHTTIRQIHVDETTTKSVREILLEKHPPAEPRRVTAPLVKHIIEQPRKLPAETQEEQLKDKQPALKTIMTKTLRLTTYSPLS